MDLEDFLRSTPDELQHFGVKGMKWGRRKPSAKKLAKKDAKWVKKQISDSVKTSKLKENYTKSIEADKATVKKVSDKVLGKELSDRNASYLKNASAKREVKGAARKQLAKARAKDLSEKLSKGLNIAVAVNDVYGDISPTGLKNHFANAEQLEKYGIEYNP